MTSRLTHAIVFTLFTVFMFIWLSRVATGVATLSKGYTLMSLDVNQLFADGSLQIVDESVVKRVLDVERLDAGRFGDELTARYSGANGEWIFAGSGAWLAFWVLVYFTLYNWVLLFRDRKRLRSSV